MRRFRFALESLLQVKVNQIEIAKGQLSVMERQQAQRRKSLTVKELQLQSVGENRLASILQGIGGESLLSLYDIWVRLFDEIQGHILAIEEAEQVLESKRTDYQDLHREVQMLEKIKDQAWRRWQKSLLEEEQKMLDDFGSKQYTRNLREQ